MSRPIADDGARREPTAPGAERPQADDGARREPPRRALTSPKTEVSLPPSSRSMASPVTRWWQY